jgi:hypothetical protein
MSVGMLRTRVRGSAEGEVQVIAVFSDARTY